MKLLIVESPAKSKTITSYLGDDYLVMASMGHVRDLRIKGKGGFGVDIEDHFKPEYQVLPEKEEMVNKLREEANIAEKIFLATDPDREGEAISWHLQEVLDQPKKKFSRVVFNEITKTAVVSGIQNARDVDMDLVHSQESRRILDRIIGFRLSSLLQQKIGSKSAGRVQSAALKIIVEREKEIEAFNSEEYWDVFANLQKDEVTLKSKFLTRNGEKCELKSGEAASEVVNAVQGSKFVVKAITKKNRNRSARPPFITSTLQQDAGAKYRYSAKRVMMIAQRLYEGIDLGKERVGLITYMRTDSARLADEFISEAKEYITEKYGASYYKGYKQKVAKDKKIQDAHEAIRPTHLDRTPDSIKRYLNAEELKLYTLIYNRAVSALMKDAIIEDTKVEIDANGYGFGVDGQKVLFDGFLKIYEEMNIDDEEGVSQLPTLVEGEELKLLEITQEQKFTNPPYRYTEARLIRKMEELGIGRPSTYALTMETLRARSYVTMENRTFVPTAQGRLTSEQLDLFFGSIINVKYTAEMEAILDEIADGSAVWYNELKKFYDEFAPMVENARDNMVKIYPKVTDEFCPECGLPLFIRRGPFGEFTACSGYPHCKYIKKAPKKEVVSTGVKCPVCGEGEIVERIANRGRSKGTKFYACSRYPQCKATYSGIPMDEKCPECDAPMIKLGDETIRCGNEHCKTNAHLHPAKVKQAKTSGK